MFILDLIEGRVVIGPRAFDRDRIVLEIGGRHDGDLRESEQNANDEEVDT